MAVELTPTRCNEWAFVFALEREASTFRKLCPDARIEIIGVGAERAAANIQRLIERQPPTAIILAGYGGGLRSELQIGDVVIAKEIASHEPAAQARVPLLALRASKLTRTHYKLISVPQIIGSPARKRELHAQSRADVVDIESYAVAEVCDRLGMPWAVVRVISDTVDTELSPIIADIINNGNVSKWNAIKAVLRRPMIVREFYRLARNTRIASYKLAQVLVETSSAG